MRGGGGCCCILFDLSAISLTQEASIHPIDMKFGTYNKLYLYFQLREITWCLIGFHCNDSQIDDVTGGRLFGFSNFQILFKFEFLYFKMHEEKTAFND